MNQKIATVASVLVGLFSLVIQTQIADAQSANCSSGCGHMTNSSCGCGPQFNYGCGSCRNYGVSSAQIRCYATPLAGSCGIQPYGSIGTCGPTGNCGSGYGILGNMLFGRSEYYDSVYCGYPSYGMNGCFRQMGSCYSSCGERYSVGYRQRSNCRYQRTSRFCCQLSSGYTGASAGCCVPAPTTCCGQQSIGYSVQQVSPIPVPSVTTPAPTLNPQPAVAPTPATAPAPSAP